MLEEMLKNAKRNARGRRLLTSDQKAVIVQEWAKSALSCPEFSRRHDLLGGMGQYIQAFPGCLETGGITETASAKRSAPRRWNV